MTYEAKTEDGKAAIAAGADPTVVEDMEKEAAVSEPEAKHVEKEVEKEISKAPEEGAEEAVKIANEAPEEGEEETPDRTPRHMPIWKHKEEIKKAVETAVAEARTEFDKELTRIASKEGTTTVADINKFADEFNLTPEVAVGMIDRMATVLDEKLGLSKLRKSAEELEKRNQVIAEEQGFNNEWDSEETTNALRKIAGDREITKAVKEKVKELAYSTTYAKYRLSDIIRLESGQLFAPEAKEHRTAEVSRGGSGRGNAQKPVTEMSGDELNSLSDAEFLKLSNEVGSKGSKYSTISRVKR